jgi:hypothetical protein
VINLHGIGNNFNRWELFEIVKQLGLYDCLTINAFKYAGLASFIYSSFRTFAT